MKKYISDVITKEEIYNKWAMGMKILITAQTGAGKSYFIQNTLYEYCKENDIKCVLFSNRDLLKRQNMAFLEDKMDVFYVENYQNIEIKLDGGIDFGALFSKYQVVVFDEAHHFFFDSSFNRRTDLLLKTLKQKFPNKIFVFLTATPQILLEYHREYDLKYNLGSDYSYIESLSFYTKDSAVEAILQNLEYGEKAIFFANKTKDAYIMAEKFAEESSFICSESSDYKNHRNEETLREIALTESFSSKILCTTKVLDNGVNIKDPDVRTIIIETSDPINLIQSIGRKRILENSDKIKLYVKDVHNGILYQKIKECNQNLQFVEVLESFGSSEFQQLYKKRDFKSIVDNDYTVNVAKFHYYKFLKSVYNKMRKKEKGGFQEYVCELLKYDIAKVRFADDENKIGKMKDVLEEYVGKKIFKEDQMELRRRFFLSAHTNGIGNRNWSINAINGILKDEKIPFVISSDREFKGDMRGKRYWFVYKIEE